MGSGRIYSTGIAHDTILQAEVYRASCGAVFPERKGMRSLTTPDKRKLQKHNGEMMEHLGEILNAFFIKNLQRNRQEGERIRLQKLKRIKRISQAVAE